MKNKKSVNFGIVLVLVGVVVLASVVFGEEDAMPIRGGPNQNIGDWTWAKTQIEKGVVVNWANSNNRPAVNSPEYFIGNVRGYNPTDTIHIIDDTIFGYYVEDKISASLPLNRIDIIATKQVELWTTEGGTKLYSLPEGFGKTEVSQGEAKKPKGPSATPKEVPDFDTLPQDEKDRWRTIAGHRDIDAIFLYKAVKEVRGDYEMAEKYMKLKNIGSGLDASYLVEATKGNDKMAEKWLGIPGIGNGDDAYYLIKATKGDEKTAEEWLKIPGIGDGQDTAKLHESTGGNKDTAIELLGISSGDGFYTGFLYQATDKDVQKFQDFLKITNNVKYAYELAYAAKGDADKAKKIWAQVDKEGIKDYNLVKKIEEAKKKVEEGDKVKAKEEVKKEKKEETVEDTKQLGTDTDESEPEPSTTISIKTKMLDANDEETDVTIITDEDGVIIAYEAEGSLFELGTDGTVLRTTLPTNELPSLTKTPVSESTEEKRQELLTNIARYAQSKGQAFEKQGYLYYLVGDYEAGYTIYKQSLKGDKEKGIKKGDNLIEMFSEMSLPDFFKNLKSENAHKQSIENRRKWISAINEIFYPGPGAIAFEKLLEDKVFRRDITYDPSGLVDAIGGLFGLEQVTQWAKDDYYIENQKLCKDANEKITGLFIPPSRLKLRPIAGGGQHLNALAKRTESSIVGEEGLNWRAYKCDYNDGNPKWFPKRVADKIEPRGYLYKLQYIVQHPYTKEQIDELDSEARKKLNLDEEGNLLFRVKLISRQCSNAGTRDAYYMPGGNRWDKLMPEERYIIKTISFYHLAFIEKICLQFLHYEIPTRNEKEYCTDVKTEDIQVPPEFSALPTDTNAAGIIQRGNDIFSPFSSTGKPAPDYDAYPCLLPGTPTC